MARSYRRVYMSVANRESHPTEICMPFAFGINAYEIQFVFV